MKTRFLRPLLLCVLSAFILVACFPATPPPEVVTNTLEPAAPVAYESPYPPPPTNTSPPTATLEGYVAPATPTPRPTSTPTATPYAPINLPPLPTYAPLGPFREMRLLYTKNDPPGYYTIKIDGTDETRWPVWPANHGMGYPGSSLHIAPNGDGAVYTLWNTMNPEIASVWRINLDGINYQELATFSLEWTPEEAIWSPDGSQIAYRRLYWAEGEAGVTVSRTELWVVNADGTNQRRVTNDPAFWIESFGGLARYFRWMQNGYIYFLNIDNQFYAVNPNNGTLYKLLEKVDVSTIYSTLSPNGQLITTSSNFPESLVQQAGFLPINLPVDLWSSLGNQFIYHNELGTLLFDTTTNQEQLLFNYPIQPVSFSPDDKYLAYQTEEDLYVLDLNTLLTQLVISSSTEINFIAWWPIQQ